MDPVSPSLGAHEHQNVSWLACSAADESVVLDQADAHGVDQGVAGVAVREADLAADVGDAHAVAVTRDAGDDPFEQVAVARLRERAEAKRVEEGDGPRAHGEDVADDAPHPCGRTLVRLDGRWMVVRLDLHRDREAVSDVDDPGVLDSGPDEEPRAVGGEDREQRLGVLVAAVLTPERAEHPELDGVRLAPQPVDDRLVLGLG